MIATGGMGEVYRARDTRLDRTVAIKILPAHFADDRDRRDRFQREARIVSSLNHPHICALYDVGLHEGVQYLVMEYVEGETLHERLRRGPVPVTEALGALTQIADALDKAHRRGIVHRDLKPGNIMWTKSGVKLLDFGLAARRPSSGAAGDELLPTEHSRTLTVEGTIMGTVPYMAPEQLQGLPVDARTDIFAFGAVGYEMITPMRSRPSLDTCLRLDPSRDRNPRIQRGLTPSGSVEPRTRSVWPPPSAGHRILHQYLRGGPCS